MADLIEFIASIIIICLVLFLLVFIPFGAYSIIESSNTKEALYTECLTTDYDKFQCYSMIYGDK